MARNMDVNYVSNMKSLNDWLWRHDEKRLYYSYKNENYVLPTIMLCIISFFTGGYTGGIAGIILFVGGALFLCHCNNVELDNSPSILQKRKHCREFRREYMNMDV